MLKSWLKMTVFKIKFELNMQFNSVVETNLKIYTTKNINLFHKIYTLVQDENL